MDYRARQGDLVWLTLDPQTGQEQMGRRPALVISNNTFNDFTRVLAMVCPVTSTDRDIPIQVRLDARTKTSGVIMCDQAKILDLQKRNAELIEAVPEDIVFEAIDIVHGFIEIAP
ncbi:MAG: type II toxin-antitoxin system PemK/MazF family toxin [Oscillospiraceae bacterium]|nr:type II toxin-antitoxin system PemK/MazF family toxin [Oscillospiraceae bacterium]